MFFECLPPELVRPFDQFLVRSLDRSACMGRGDLFDVLRRELQFISFGHATYRFRSTIVANYYPGVQGSVGRLVTSPSLASCVGYGETFDDALKNWAEQFHVRFQSLLAMRPWEMNEEEQDEWEKTEQLVDISAYRRETPRRTRQIGIIAQARHSATRGHQQPSYFQRRLAIPNRVEWESGRKEDIDLTMAVSDFASLRPGQRFEATVLRDAQAERLIGIVDIVPLPGLPGASEAKAIWDTLPTSEDIERVDWANYE